MAEELANAIVDAAKKMHKKENISTVIETLALYPDIKFVPLYECSQKCYSRNNERGAFELRSFKTYYEFDQTESFEDVFKAMRKILNVGRYKRRWEPTYKIEEDDELKNKLIGFVFENMQIEDDTKVHIHKKIVALFRSKQDRIMEGL